MQLRQDQISVIICLTTYGEALSDPWEDTVSKKCTTESLVCMVSNLPVSAPIMLGRAGVILQQLQPCSAQLLSLDETTAQCKNNVSTYCLAYSESMQTHSYDIMLLTKKESEYDEYN